MARPRRISLPFLANASTPASIAEAAWFARASALGASPPAATRAAVLAFFTSFYSAGFVLTDIDFFYLMIGENSGDTSTNRYNQKRVNLISPGTFDATITSANASGHLASGTQGNKTMYWNTGYNSGTAVNPRTSVAFEEIITDLGTGGSQCDAGVYSGSGGSTINVRLLPAYDAASVYGEYGNGGLVGNVFPSGRPVPELFVIQGSGGTNTLYRNTTSIGSAGSVTNQTPPANSIYVFGLNDHDSSVIQLSDVTMSMLCHRRPFTGPELTAWYGILQTLMAAFSVTI